MPTPRVPKESNDQMYFVTMTVLKWFHLFNETRWKNLADSLRYCQENKGLNIYAYVFMINHIHLIIQAPDVSGVIRDFKCHTSKTILREIRTAMPHLLKYFEVKDGIHELWKRGNMPEIIETDWFLNQKMDYIHNNPVEKGYVEKPEDWYWSSSNYYENGVEGPIKIEPLDI